MALNIHCEGKKYTAKITPMQKLQVLLEQVIAQIKAPPNLSSCQLLINGKQADLNMPLRYANLPPNAKLEVTTGRASKLGVQQSNDTKLSSGSAPAASSQPAHVQLPAGNTALPDSYRQGTAPPLTARTFSQKVDCQPLDIPSRSSPTQATDRNLVSGTNAAAKQSGADCGSTQNSATHSRFAAMGLDREVCVFSRADLEAAMPSGRMEDPPDAFYEFGVGDFAAVMQGYSKSKSEAEKGLRTAKMRDQDEREKASRFPLSVIRIEFPDGYLLQMQVKSLETISAVSRTVQQCLDSRFERKQWHLYVTPPKQVLSNETLTIFQASLCPAAKLYFGTQQSPPFLRPEIISLQAGIPNEAERKAVVGSVDAKVEEKGKETSERHASAAQYSRQSSSGAKTAPKWLKLSKK